MSKRPVPTTSQLGMVALGFLAALLFTGIYLALSYKPDPVTAHPSVKALQEGASGVVRSVHSWSANLLIALLLVHAGRAWVLASSIIEFRYRAMLGLAALATALVLLQVGTILPWDQRAWEAYQHLAAGLSVAGARLDAGDPSNAPLRALWFLHVLILPALLVAFMLFHLRRRGGANSRVRARALWASSRHFVVVSLAVLLLLALLFPPFLGPEPIPALQVTRPAWPFLWLVPLQDWWGARALWTLPAALAVSFGLVATVPKLSVRAREAILVGAGIIFFWLTWLGLR